MDIAKVFPFLRDIAENNYREWFVANKDRYDIAYKEYAEMVATAIINIGKFDPTILHLSPKDCIYRFYRDIRFSPDKSPYKRHFGAYMCCMGKTSLRGGYYIHVQPDNSFVAVGAYCLPTNILTACRNEIMSNIDEWRGRVENKQFVKLYGRVGENSIMSTYTEEMPARGFGSTQYLKKCPKDFPSDYEFVDYLRMKDYCCWHKVSDDFFDGDGWIAPTMEMFRVAKPMMDFINAVIADYD